MNHEAMVLRQKSSILRGPPPLKLDISRVAFGAAWLFIMALHAVCGTYLICVAMTYWFISTDTMQFYASIWSRSGTKHYHLYGFVFGMIGGVHGVQILRIIFLSIRSRRLVLSSDTKMLQSFPLARTNRMNRYLDGISGLVVPSSRLQEALVHYWNMFFSRQGLFGVESEHFSSVFALREVLDVSSQTYQAFRTSNLLPSVKLNDFNVALLVVDCWSTAVIQYFLRKSPALQRVITLLSDALISFFMVVLIPLNIFIPFVNSFSFQHSEFKNQNVLDDTTSLALFSQENQLIFVASLGDFVSKIIPHMGIFLSLAAVTELIGINEPKVSPCEDSVDEAVELTAKLENDGIKTLLTASSTIVDGPPTCSKMHGCLRRLRTLYQWEHVIAGVVFFLWGLMILALHIAAAQRATSYDVAGCRTVTRPWFSNGKVPCSSLVYDCYARNTTSLDDESLNSLDPKTLVGLAIVHCPALSMPTNFQVFTSLMMIHVYNSTIVNWDVDSSISASKHTRLMAVFMRKAQMVELPAGMMQPLPVSLKSIRMSETNLSALPEDLSTRWNALEVVTFDDGALTEIPESFFSLNPYIISIAGNQIKAIPALANMPPGTVIPVVRLTGNPLQELPAELKASNSFIVSLDVQDTELSSFPAWVQSQTSVVWAFDTPFCRASKTNSASPPVECFDSGSTVAGFPAELFDRLYNIETD